MDKIEVIEEKKMIRRLLTKFFGNTFIYGLLYVACMVIFLMVIIFQEENTRSLITMICINSAINLGFMMMLISSSVNGAFNGINTVNVPEKSRGRILSMMGTILMIVMVFFTVINVIMFHALFKSKIDVCTYTASSLELVEEVKAGIDKKVTTFISVEEVSENEYLVISKTYTKDALVIIGGIVLLNFIIVLIAIGYESGLLKKYLVT